MTSKEFPELRAKIKALAEAAKILRAEQKRFPPSSLEWVRLRDKRTPDIAIEARAALVAYAFLRGKPYRRIENEPRWRVHPHSAPMPDWSKVLLMVIEHGKESDALKTIITNDEKQYKDYVWDKIVNWLGKGWIPTWPEQRPELVYRIFGHF